MILVAGGTGLLGTRIVQSLAAGGHRVRVMTRDPARAALLRGDGVEIVPGDVRDPAAVARAVEGVRTLVSAVHGFAGPGATSPEAVDWRGNANLVQAAKAAGAEHFVMVSIQGISADHPMDLYRMKHRAEQELRASGLSFTIIRATAFMELWARMIGEPLVTKGRTVIFGRGRNPINFVSVHDVATFVMRAVTDPALRGETIEVGGPENLTFLQVAEIFQRETGKRGAVRHMPLPVMRAMSVLMRPVNRVLARQIHAGVVMDTIDMTFDGTVRARRWPDVPLTTLAEVVRRDFTPS